MVNFGFTVWEWNQKMTNWYDKKKSEEEGGN